MFSQLNNPTTSSCVPVAAILSDRPQDSQSSLVRQVERIRQSWSPTERARRAWVAMIQQQKLLSAASKSLASGAEAY